MRRGTVRMTSVLVVVLLGVVVGVGVTAADSGETENDTTVDATHAVGTTPAQTNTITVEQEYRLTPDRPGRVDIRWKFTIPDNVAEISTQLPGDATNPRQSGFEKAADGYVWKESEQSTRTPTLTFTTAVNQTDDVSGPIGSDGKYMFVDAGDWALIEREPGPAFSLRYRGDRPAVERTNTTAGPGVTGQAMIFLGPHEEYTQTKHDQRFRLVVPDAATLSPSREDVFDTVTNASASFRVGDRDRQVLMFVAPATVPWGVRGLQTGDRDFYGVADEPVDTADNVWIHEYVHTRQDFERTDNTAWVVEATAQYYAGLLTLEQGRIDFEEFRDHLARGQLSRFDDVVLADRTTWEGTGGNYYTGSLAAGEIDRRLRHATDREQTLQAALRRMNGQSSPVQQSDFLGYVGSVGGTGPRDAARCYTETTDRPSLWSRSQHSETFQPLPPEFAYTFPPAGSDDIQVTGPYRNRTLGSGPLVPGERLAVAVNVTNVGGSEGTYDLTVTRDGEQIATRSGTLLAGRSTSERVETAFDEPGTYTLSAGEEEYTVMVEDPATPSVTDLRVNRTRVAGGGAVRVTAVVENPAGRPANGTVAIRQGEEELLDRQVRLDAGASTQMSTTVRLSELGIYQFSAGERSASVTVEDGTATGGEAGAGASGPGFGALGAILGLLGSLLVAQRRE